MSSVKEQIAAIVDQRGPIRDYLANLPPDTRLYPGDSCDCILHGLIAHRFGTRNTRIFYDEIVIDGTTDVEPTVYLDIEGSLWERLQEGWDGVAGIEAGAYIYPATALAVLEATE